MYGLRVITPWQWTNDATVVAGVESIAPLIVVHRMKVIYQFFVGVILGARGNVVYT